jgi:hypothetical protein
LRKVVAAAFARPHPRRQMQRREVRVELKAANRVPPRRRRRHHPPARFLARRRRRRPSRGNLARETAVAAVVTAAAARGGRRCRRRKRRPRDGRGRSRRGVGRGDGWSCSRCTRRAAAR